MKKYEFYYFDGTVGAIGGGLFGFAVSILAEFKGIGQVIFVAAIMFCFIMFFGFKRIRKEVKK